MTDRVGKVLEKVNRELCESLVFAEGRGDSERDIIAQVLEERLGPLLRAGQAMSESIGTGRCAVAANEWDAALAALERERTRRFHCRQR